MRHAIYAAVVGTLCLGITSASFAADELSGSVIKLAEKTSTTELQTVNVGGLVIAVVRDSGSRPPQNISIVASDSLKSLGKVRGVQNDQGQALMGGGYTWHLFQPTQAGDATVKVAYTENGDGGKKVERTFHLKIE
jgi:hypothetical protein